MKNILAKFSLVFLSLMTAFFLFAVIACWLPDRAVKEHVSQIAPFFQEQGNYPQAIIPTEACRQDNFTDALILNQMFCVDRKAPVKSAMGMVRVDYEPEYDKTGALFKTVGYQPGGTLVTYARYWHGNTFLFRILLLFMDYQTMQWLMFAVSSLLLAVFLCTFYVRAGVVKTLAYLLSWLLTYGFITQFSMQFFPATTLALVASILVVRHWDDLSYMAMLFFVIACLTCYFDLLTTPLLTLGWPLVVWAALQGSATLRTRDTLLRMMGWGILWGLGYSLTFLAKWGIGSSVLGINVLKDAADSSLCHVGADDFSRWDAIVQNMHMIPWTLVLLVFVVLIVLCLLRFSSEGGFKAAVLLVMATMPYWWYFLLPGHSYHHYWFTYRLQAVTLAAVFMAVLSLCGEFRVSVPKLHPFSKR